MVTILELNTGLFPDAETVAKSIATREGIDRVVHLDLCGLKPDDTDSWDAVAAEIISADLVVTL